MLALSFLLLIGFTLVVEGLHQHIPKGYIYFAMAFSVFVELLNLRAKTGAGEGRRASQAAPTVHRTRRQFSRLISRWALMRPWLPGAHFAGFMGFDTNIAFCIGR